MQNVSTRDTAALDTDVNKMNNQRSELNFLRKTLYYDVTQTTAVRLVAETTI